jgi:hypothetical protein
MPETAEGQALPSDNKITLPRLLMPVPGEVTLCMSMRAYMLAGVVISTV